MTRVLSIGECMVELSPAPGGLWRQRFAGDTFNTAWHLRRCLPAADAVGFLTTLGQGPVSDEMAAFIAAAGIEPDIARHPTRGPGYAHGWAGAVLKDPAAAKTHLSPGSVTWGGIYGHCWYIDPARQRTLVALTNTAVEGMAGAFSVDLREAAASAPAPS